MSFREVQFAFAGLLLALTALALQGQQPAEKYPAETGSFTAADGVQLFYCKQGSGHDFVVFLHGGPGLSMGDGGYAMRPLAGQQTLMLYDQRGGGRSDRVKDPRLFTAER